jgi:leucyl-tRNA synthetase
VLLGKGELTTVVRSTGFAKEVIESIKSEFEYWYPLDINLGGKEHMTVHFPVFLMNHVAVLRPQHWPRGILVNWYITSTGGKISKSKGGAQPIPDAAERFGVDAMRLFYAHIASLYVDVAWDDEKVDSYRDRLERLWSLVQELSSVGTNDPSEVDMWLETKMQTRLARLHEYMAEYDLRSYSNDVYFEIPQDIRWYLRRGGKNRSTIMNALGVWIPLMAPVTPHVAEEMWESVGRKRFVSTVQLQPGAVTESSLAEEAKEVLIERLIADVAEIVKVTNMKPKKAVIMVAPKWKHDMLAEALAHPNSRPEIPSLIKSAMAKAHAPESKKEIPGYAKELVSELSKTSPEERRALTTRIDELSVLTKAKSFLETELGYEVFVFSADDPTRTDPKGKARFAKPGRPAVYLE